MKRYFGILSSILFYIFALIGIYWIANTCFDLMSTRSTVKNTLGFAGLALLLASIILFITQKTKK